MSGRAEAGDEDALRAPGRMPSPASAGTSPPGGLRTKLKHVPGLVPVVRTARALATPLGRGRLIAQARRAALFQPDNTTRADRHPALFAAVAAELAATPSASEAPRILSFGCSTGEEAFTLARLFPGAAIDAVDANPACVAAARAGARRLGLATVAFRCADDPDALAPACYDAVLCLSVLRHHRLDALKPARSTDWLPFARFAGAVAALDRRLAPGGILALWGCNFRFADTETAARYHVIPTPVMRPLPGPYYGPGDTLLSVDSYAAFAFRKLA